MATTVTRELKEINAEVVKLNSGIKNATNQNRQLDRSLKLDPSSTVLLTQKTENLRTQLTLATQKVTALKNAQKTMRQEVDAGKGTEDEYKKISIEVAKAEAQVKSFTTQVKQANNQKLTNLQSNLQGVSRAATVAIGAIVALGYKYTETGDKISKATAKYMISAEEFQQGSFIFDRTAGNADDYAAALENIQQQMSAVAKGSSRAITAFEAIGVSVDELNGKSTAEVYDLIIGKLQQIADADDRLTLANTLLTTAGYGVAQVSELTSEELEALNEQLALNGTLTQEEADAAAELKDRWENFELQMQKVIMDLGESLIPLMDSLIEIASLLIPVISVVAGIFGAMPKSMQFIVAIILILLAILPKLIAIIKVVNTVLAITRGLGISNPFIMIATAVAALILLLVLLAKWLNSIFNKSYSLDVDTSSLGTDISSLTGQATTTATTSTTDTTTNYYDYSTTNVEAHTDADIDDIAEQLSTKIKVGGG